MFLQEIYFQRRASLYIFQVNNLSWAETYFVIARVHAELSWQHTYVFLTLRSNFFTIGFQTGSDETQVETEKLIYPLSSLVSKLIHLISAYLNFDQKGEMNKKPFSWLKLKVDLLSLKVGEFGFFLGFSFIGAWDEVFHLASAAWSAKNK